MNTPLSLVIVGHVDHGKSTVIGRLLHDAGALPEGKVEAVQKMCEKRGMPFEWAFVMDALQTERDQGITIDTTRIWFKAGKQSVMIIDAPGHKEFLRNMISGAAHAEAALLVVDAREGVSEQTRRHAALLHLLGITQVAVLVNKMDSVDFAESTFTKVSAELAAYLKKIGVPVSAIIPVSARDGDNIATCSARMKWYRGGTALEALAAFKPCELPVDKPLRFTVQDVYKFDERRIIAGRVESGKMKVGDELLFSPSGARARIASFEAWPEKSAPKKVEAGACIGLTLDAPVFVERGQIASHVKNAPMLTAAFRARIFWLGEKPLNLGKRTRLKLGTADVSAELREIEAVIDTATLERKGAVQVSRGEVAEVIFRTRGLVPADPFAANPATGRFVIVEGYDIAGGGTIDLTGFADQRVAEAQVKSQNITPFSLDISSEERARANGHNGGILWFTGLSGAGKTTIAQALQRALFAKGYQAFVLDGDNIRKGLSRDLGFSPADRNENLRRAGEVAALFAQGGVIVVTAFISPTHAGRAMGRAAAAD